MDTPLTARQQAILEFIRKRIGQGLPPTRADIAEAFGFASRSAAEQHLRALADKGAIVLAEGRARGIRLPVPAAASADTLPGRLPLVGRVAAGQPILATAHVETLVAVDPDWFRPRADYLLRVHGDSMVEDGILDGDCVAVHRQADAPSGTLVVARLGEEVTVKRLERSGTTIRLLPANPAYRPIVPDPTLGFCIEGRVVGVLRRNC